MTRRADDNEATIQRRLAIYKQEVAPLLGFYEDRVSGYSEIGRRLVGDWSDPHHHHHHHTYTHIHPSLISTPTHTNCLQGTLRTFHVKKGVRDAPALEAMMTADGTN